MPDPRFFGPARPFDVQDLIDWTGATCSDVVGLDKACSGISDLKDGGDGKLCYLVDINSHIADNIAVCFTTEPLAERLPANTIVLVTNNPVLAFAVSVNQIYPTVPGHSIGPTRDSSGSIIADSSQTGLGCSIAAGSFIGPNVLIGDNCIIASGAVLGAGVKIGDNCVIGANVSITFSILGDNAVIHQGASIGQDGFGFTFDEVNATHTKIPHLGRVVIKNDVEVGANTTIDRGSLGDTIIGDGCRIGDLVHIAHNVEIGRRAIIVAQVGISGSCKIGDDVILAGQVGIADHVVIGSKVRVAAKSGVIKDVAEGESVMGYPAKPIKRFWRETVALGRLIRNSKPDSI